jgi:hypothetical protein
MFVSEICSTYNQIGWQNRVNSVSHPTEPANKLAILVGGFIRSNLSRIPPHVNAYLEAHEKSFIENSTSMP